MRREAHHKPEHGFTLVELLVVLVLLGLLSGVALPRMQRWHDAVQARAQGAELVGALREAAFAAGAKRVQFRLSQVSFATDEPPAGVLKVRLPEGWIAKVQREPGFLANGLCMPGEVLLRSDRGVDMRLQVLGPRCIVSLEEVTGWGA